MTKNFYLDYRELSS